MSQVVEGNPTQHIGKSERLLDDPGGVVGWWQSEVGIGKDVDIAGREEVEVSNQIVCLDRRRREEQRKEEEEEERARRGGGGGGGGGGVPHFQ